MAKLTPSQIEQARARGADVQVIPKLIDVQGLIDQFKQMIAASTKGQVVVLSALRELNDTIRSKKIQGTDVTEIVKALQNLESCYEPMKQCDYIIDFERDQRGLFKTGIRLRAVTNET